MNSGTTSKLYVYHLMALSAVVVWGTTFVSTKVLLSHGLSPEDIFFYRFLMAYLAIWFFSPKKVWSACLKDELLFLGAGITGGSVYFLTENTALGITLASNVSLIICTAPVITAFLVRLLYRQERIGNTLIWGSLVALAGVGLVVFNGRFILKINPLGDVLSLTAALMWALYNLIVKRLERYPMLFVTRKVFFYGLLTILPMFLITPLNVDPAVLFRPVVLGNLLFLGFLASMVCFILWNVSVKHLGAIRATNYIYVVPLVTLLTSAVVIDEPVTGIAMAGTVLILAGVYVAENGVRLPVLSWKVRKGTDR